MKNKDKIKMKKSEYISLIIDGLFFGLVFGLFFGLVLGLLGGLVLGLFEGLVLGLLGGLLGGLLCVLLIEMKLLQGIIYGLILGPIYILGFVFTIQVIAYLVSNPDFVMFDMVASAVLLIFVGFVGGILKELEENE